MKISTPARTEVDRRVAQELKNHEDFVWQTNQALQNLKIAFDALRADFTKHADQIGSKVKAQEIVVENLEERTEDKVKKHSSVIDNFGVKFSQFVEMIANDLKGFELRYAHAGEHQSLSSFVQQKFKEIDAELARIDAHLNFQVQRLEQRIADSIEALKKSLLSMPSEVPAIKKEVDDKLTAYESNHNGLTEKIEILSKSLFRAEKEIEELFLMFGRLKAGKA